MPRRRAAPRLAVVAVVALTVVALSRAAVHDEEDEEWSDDMASEERNADDTVWPEPDKHDMNVMHCWRTLKHEEREPGSATQRSVDSCKTRLTSRKRNGEDKPHDSPDEYAKMKAWFERNGGELHNVAAELIPHGRCGEATLVAQDDIEFGEAVVRAPLKTTLNKWTMKKMTDSNAARHLKTAFDRHEEWGLALLLVHEFMHGSKSKWWPYIQTLRACELGDSISKELRGTSGAAILGGWWDDMEELYSFCQEGPLKMKSNYFQRNPEKKMGTNTYTRDDLGWGLNVVRKHALTVFNNSTKSSFLSLVPYADLMQHDSSAEGNATLISNALSDLIEISAQASGMGSPMTHRMRVMSDAEALVWYHHVGESHNPDDYVRIQLPEAAQPENNIIQRVNKLRKWRKQMAMPPRAADLWQANNDLQLYGRPAEYEMPMLAGGGMEDSETGEVAYVYSFLAGLDVPDPESKEHQMSVVAAKNMDEAVEQLDYALQAAYEDESVQLALNATTDLLFYGVEPDRGLDVLDLMLIRKMNLRTECGDPKTHTLSLKHVSDNLLCAMRITLSTEKELDQLCPKSFHWNDGCEGGIFRWRRPISRRNEEVMLATLRDTLASLAASYPTRAADDELLLGMASLTHPRLRSAVHVRMREQQLLHNAATLIDALEEKLDDNRYQIFEMPAWRTPLMIAPGEPPPVVEQVPIVSMPVDFGGGRSESLQVFDGQTVERVVTSFAAKWHVADQDAQRLVAEAFVRLPEGHPTPTLTYALSVAMSSGRKTLALYENETVGDAVATFCALYQVPQDSKLSLSKTLSKRVKSRAAQKVLLSIPVTAPHGRVRNLTLLQGDQHSLEDVALNFASAMVLPETAAAQLVEALTQRLPKFAFSVPVAQGEGKAVLNLRVLEGDDPFEVSSGFCQANDLDEGEMIPKLVRVIQGKMRSLGMPVYINHFLNRNALLGD